jgi:SAM-dependent methyltransferase
MQAHDNTDLKRIYSQRFSGVTAYRSKVWQTLIGCYFSKFIPENSSVLDLGCGYGEFINNVRAGHKYGMDLNPDSAERLHSDVTFLSQDCSERWNLPDHSLDVVFTSNFFEHLPDKASLGKTLDEVRRCLKPSGRLIAMGPNVKHLPGAYWDFWDHYLPLTELSLKEALETRGFTTELCIGKFLPYTMAGKRQTPIAMIKAYLAMPVFWRFFGKQFLVIAHS